MGMQKRARKSHSLELRAEGRRQGLFGRIHQEDGKALYVYAVRKCASKMLLALREVHGVE